MHYRLILKLLVLLLLANGSPVIAKRLFGNQFRRTVDGNIRFIDGRPLFGHSKTLRGVLVSSVVTAVSAPVLGLSFNIGLLVGTSAMAGDLLSSFVKRRLSLRPSSRAVGLDQIPESLLPLVACGFVLPLAAGDIALGTASFMLSEMLLSRLLFRCHLREHPY